MADLPAPGHPGLPSLRGLPSLPSLPSLRGLLRALPLQCVALGLLTLTPGCVLRKLHVRSEPPGAEVFIDGRSVGSTPYEEEFQWYGTHRVELRLPGYLRHVRLLEVERPWWQVFPLSFITEVLWPFEIRDEHALELNLQPLPDLSSAEVEAAARAAYERLTAVRALAPGGSSDPADDVSGAEADSADPADDAPP